MNKNAVHQSIIHDIDKIKKSNIMNNESDLLIRKNKTSDYIQKFVMYSHEGFFKKIFKPILCDAIFRAESMSEGAGEICLRFTIEKIEESMRRISLGENINKIKKDIAEEINKIYFSSNKDIKRVSSKNIKNIINQFTSSEDHIEIFDCLFENGLSTIPMIVEKSNRMDTVISIESGFNFSVGCDPSFLLEKKSWNRKNVSCLVIDGIIESIGEIHHLLESASSSGEPYVLFVRGLSDDVKNTIMYNVSRGTIDVIPICVGFDENTLNILNDISICTNSHLVSSYTGDLISKASTGPLSIVEKIEITDKKVSITSSPNKKELAAHIRYLKKKKEDAVTVSEEVSNIFSDRIRSLTEGKIVLNVGRDAISKDPLFVEKFDKCLRSISSSVSEGIIEDTTTPIFKYIKNRSVIPSLAAYYGLFFSKSCLSSILSVGHALIEDSD